MARPARRDILGDGPATVHLTARCHNEDFLLKSALVKGMLYFLLFTYKLVFGILVYHYCFMDNHIHLILYAPSTEALSKFIHQVLSQLARFINKRSGRKGQVFMDRARTPVIQDGRRFLVTMRYLDKNPIRAGIVTKATDYAWSSYGYYAWGQHDDLIDPAPEYLGLHVLASKRRSMYRELVNRLMGRGEERLPEMTTWYFIGDPAWVVGMMRRAGLIRPRKPPDIF
jgi:putative transposase